MIMAMHRAAVHNTILIYRINPYLNFVTEMVGESAYISLRCRDGIDGIKNIKVALIQAGKQTVSVDLTQNYDIMKMAGADKKLHLYGIIFTTDKFGANESLSFKNFRFTSQKETNKNDRYWLDAAADSKWYNWDAGPNSGDLRFIIIRAAFYS